MSDVIYVSASQLKLWDDEDGEGCQRAWAYKYIEQKPDPPGPGAITGTRVHKIIECKLLRKPLPDFATKHIIRIADAILATHKIPGYVQPRVEDYYTLERDGFAYRGYIDLMYPIRGKPIMVSDHKTCRTFDYQPSEKQLADDPQAVLYAKAGMEYYSQARADLQWTYGKTQGAPATRLTTCSLDIWRVDEKLETLDKKAQKIADARRNATKALDFRPNYDRCSKFGGCPFIGFCPRDVKGVFGSIFQTKEKRTMPSLTELAQRRKNGARLGLDPEKARKAYDAQERKSTKKKPPPRQVSIEQTHQPVNPPEMPDDDETLENASERVMRGEDAQDVAEEIATKVRAIPKQQIVDLVRENGVHIFSTKRGRTEDYATLRTLKALADEGKIAIDIEGDVVHARKPEAKDRHQEVWMRLACAHSDLELVDSMFDRYRELFG